MGFGWLFLGYVVSFLLSGVGAMLNMKFLVCLLGYVMILRGLWELRKYNAAFRFPLWTVFALMPATVYEMLTEWGNVFAWNAPFLSETVETVMAWVDFGITMLFHFTCYYAVAIIAKSVDLPRTVREAVFDAIVGVGYAALYTVSRVFLPESVAAQLGVPLTFFLLFWRIYDICLLVSCCKNICPAEDKDQTPKPYRWNFLNRMGERFADNFHRAADSTRASREEDLRNRRERKHRRSGGDR